MSTPPLTTRRIFLQKTALATTMTALTLPAALAHTEAEQPQRAQPLPVPDAAAFWPDGARLVISISMQFEAGGEPEIGADSPFAAVPMQAGVPDLPARTWYQYGYQEGIGRMLDLWDEFNIKVTSHMVGSAVRRNPALAREIVQRGHEASGHGLNWQPQYNMTREQEKEFIQAGAAELEKVTGQRPVGYNCNFLRRSPNTISILQELGFQYHIDDLSHDEPFSITVNDKPFMVVPYTVRCNDILLIEGRHFSTSQFQQQLRDEFTQLYAEGGKRRRLMSIAAHDRISGTPGMVTALREFLAFASKQPGVRFMRKDAIARYAAASPGTRHETMYI